MFKALYVPLARVGHGRVAWRGILFTARGWLYHLIQGPGLAA